MEERLFPASLQLELRRMADDSKHAQDELTRGNCDGIRHNWNEAGAAPATAKKIPATAMIGGDRGLPWRGC